MNGRTIRYFAGAALGALLVLGPAAADSGAAVPLEKENPTVVGVAAGGDAAATDPAQQTTKKKKKRAARSVPMVAVPLETIQPAGATTQVPPPAAPAAAAAQAAEGTAAPEPAPAAAAPQGALPAPVAQSAAAPAAAAATAEGAAVETAPAAPSPEPKQRRQLGMRPTASKTAPVAGATAAVVRKDIIGVVPPTGRISGRVLAKDGITMLGGAELTLAHGAFGSQHRVVSDASGEFDIELPIGRYALVIQRRNEIYASPTSYSVAGHGTLPIDFILLRDFEAEEAPAAPDKKGSLAGGDVSRQDGAAIDDGPARWLPEPPREPEVVGSVVDLVSPTQDAPARSRKNGAETMGFLGSILAILIVL